MIRRRLDILDLFAEAQERFGRWRIPLALTSGLVQLAIHHEAAGKRVKRCTGCGRRGHFSNACMYSEDWNVAA